MSKGIYKLTHKLKYKDNYCNTKYEKYSQDLINSSKVQQTSFENNKRNIKQLPQFNQKCFIKAYNHVNYHKRNPLIDQPQTMEVILKSIPHCNTGRKQQKDFIKALNNAKIDINKKQTSKEEGIIKTILSTPKNKHSSREKSLEKQFFHNYPINEERKQILKMEEWLNSQIYNYEITAKNKQQIITERIHILNLAYNEMCQFSGRYSMELKRILSKIHSQYHKIYKSLIQSLAKQNINELKRVEDKQDEINKIIEKYQATLLKQRLQNDKKSIKVLESFSKIIQQNKSLQYSFKQYKKSNDMNKIRIKLLQNSLTKSLEIISSIYSPAHSHSNLNHLYYKWCSSVYRAILNHKSNPNKKIKIKKEDFLLQSQQLGFYGKIKQQISQFMAENDQNLSIEDAKKILENYIPSFKDVKNQKNQQQTKNIIYNNQPQPIVQFNHFIPSFDDIVKKLKGISQSIQVQPQNFEKQIQTQTNSKEIGISTITKTSNISTSTQNIVLQNLKKQKIFDYNYIPKMNVKIEQPSLKYILLQQQQQKQQQQQINVPVTKLENKIFIRKISTCKKFFKQLKSVTFKQQQSVVTSSNLKSSVCRNIDGSNIQNFSTNLQESNKLIVSRTQLQEQKQHSKFLNYSRTIGDQLEDLDNEIFQVQAYRTNKNSTDKQIKIISCKYIEVENINANITLLKDYKKFQQNPKKIINYNVVDALDKVVLSRSIYKSKNYIEYSSTKEKQALHQFKQQLKKQNYFKRKSYKQQQLINRHQFNLEIFNKKQQKIKLCVQPFTYLTSKLLEYKSVKSTYQLWHYRKFQQIKTFKHKILRTKMAMTPHQRNFKKLISYIQLYVDPIIWHYRQLFQAKIIGNKKIFYCHQLAPLLYIIIHQVKTKKKYSNHHINSIFQPQSSSNHNSQEQNIDFRAFKLFRKSNHKVNVYEKLINGGTVQLDILIKSLYYLNINQSQYSQYYFLQKIKNIPIKSIFQILNNIISQYLQSSEIDRFKAALRMSSIKGQKYFYDFLKPLNLLSSNSTRFSQSLNGSIDFFFFLSKLYDFIKLKRQGLKVKYSTIINIIFKESQTISYEDFYYIIHCLPLSYDHKNKILLKSSEYTVFWQKNQPSIPKDRLMFILQQSSLISMSTQRDIIAEYIIYQSQTYFQPILSQLYKNSQYLLQLLYRKLNIQKIPSILRKGLIEIHRNNNKQSKIYHCLLTLIFFQIIIVKQQTKLLPSLLNGLLSLNI